MTIEIYEKIEKIFQIQQKNSQIDFDESHNTKSLNSDLIKILETETKNDPDEIKLRIKEELLGLGPIAALIHDQDITEILVNDYNQIFIEKSGKLEQSFDHFFSETSYLHFIDRLSQKCHTYMNRDKPFIESNIENLRISMIFSEISRGKCLVSIRKQPLTSWSLDKLFDIGWCTENQFEIIKNIIKSKRNFLVIGGTGSGKTSFLQALLMKLNPLERAVIIEDTQELNLPNPTCISLVTRQDPSHTVSEINMDDLLKRSLRLRPDRLVLGEIRGPEAKSLLMMMATGHDGSFGSMHARTAAEALLRLEMLVQMGAPQWTLASIRRLMAMTIQNIFVLEKKDGKRILKGIYEITSVEESGLALQQLDEGH